MVLRNKSYILVFLLITLPFIGNSQSILWRIHGNNLSQNSYLLGTVHISNSAIDEMIAPCKQYIDSCEMIALEIIPDSQSILQLIPMLIMPDTLLISNYLIKEEFQIFDSLVQAKIGFSATLFNQIYPIFLGGILTESDNSTYTSGVDFTMLNYAREKNKDEVALETVNQQIKAITSVRFEYQINLLKEIISETKMPSTEEKDETDELHELYLKQDLKKLYEYIKEAEFSESELKEFLDDRNRFMVNEIMTIIHQKSLFVAVGVGHLAGEEGMINLLSDNGYILTPINISK